MIVLIDLGDLFYDFIWFVGEGLIFIEVMVIVFFLDSGMIVVGMSVG